jgi:hypothetical protein
MVVRSCRDDPASDQSGRLTDAISGTQFWSDHGQAVPTTIFPIELWVAAAKGRPTEATRIGIARTGGLKRPIQPRRTPSRGPGSPTNRALARGNCIFFGQTIDIARANEK